MRDRPLVDLSSGTYDALENRLSQFLGLKILLVHDWKRPESCSYSRYEDGTETFGSDDPAIQELTRREMEYWKNYFNYQNRISKVHPGERPADIAAREGLRSHLQGRDQTLCDSIDDAELNSLLKKGHITLRKNNACPPHTVIVWDTDFNDKATMLRKFIGLTTFDDVYDPDIKMRHIPLDNFLENVNFDPDQARSYEALRQIRYALRHQHEHDNHDRDWYYMAFLYNFARLSDDTSWGIADKGACHSFDHYRDMYEGDFSIFCNTKSSGVDFDFGERLLIAGALSEIRYMSINPMQTVARLAASRDHEEIFKNFDIDRFARFQKTFSDTIRNACKNLARPVKGAELHAADDLRLLIPVFREIYNKKTSEPETLDAVETLYLDTLWKAAETHLPTLARAPVPTITIGGSLPKTAEGYRRIGQKHPLQLPAPG